MLSKSDVVKALIASLRRDLDAVDAAARAAHDAATHPEAKPENDKDTRALEAGYLAGAQSARAAELKQHLELVEKSPVSAFSLVTFTEKKARQTVLLSKWGGGQKLDVDDGGARTVVSVITPQSPIGEAVNGLAAGDDVEFEMGARKRHLVIVSVA